MEHILNIKAIAKKVPNKPKVANIYWKMNQSFIMDSDHMKSPELIDEVSKLIKKETGIALKKLRAWKYKAQADLDEKVRIEKALARKSVIKKPILKTK